jgi:glycosyltransferase involved in cell wall biosynthesis
MDSATQVKPGAAGGRTPLVSIVIPAYNCAATIGATIASCLKQTEPGIEVLVVNDGSTDLTAEVLATFGDAIRVVTQDNGGLARARSIGAQSAGGRYVAWMDADDLMSEERIRLQVQVLEQFPAVGLVSSDFSAFVTEDKDFEASHIASYYSSVRRRGGLDKLYPQRARVAGSGCEILFGKVYEALVMGNFVHPPTVLMRKALHDSVGYFDTSFKYSSDYDFIVRLSRITELAFIDKPLLRYRRSDLQMSQASRQGKIPLETTRIVEKIRLDDPDFYADNHAVLQQRSAGALLAAAYEIGYSDRPKALALLARSVRLQLRLQEDLRALSRILVPVPLIGPLKALRRMLLPKRPH